HVIHKVNYVAPASTTSLKLATVSEGTHLHLQPVSTVVTKYNYAVQQLPYAHYPQYQVYHHNQANPGTLQPGATTIFTAHQLHEHPVAAVHEIAHQHPQQQQQQQQQQQHQQQQQQHTAYAHQQPIYAHHPAAIHYSVPASLVHAGQHNYQQQLPLSHTQAVHYQGNQAGGQPAAPIVHQAPIATINQVHQAQQVYATQGQLTKYPLAPQSYYGAGGLQQNQIYSTVPSYGDPDTLTNLVNPTTPRFLTTSRRPPSRPIPGDIRPITEYDDDDDSNNDGNNEDGVLYRDEPTDSGDRNSDREEPCEKDSKKAGQPSAFNRNLYNMWRAYDVARTLLKASGASGASTKPRAKPETNTDTDRIQLIHPPGESDKKLKGKYYEGKYYSYYRHGRQDIGDHHGDANRTPKSVPPTSSPSSSSYTALTQPSHAASIPLAAHLKPVPQSQLQTQPSYYNTVASTNVQQLQQQPTFQQQPNVYYRNQVQQQQQQQQQQQSQQQQQRIQIYSTAASPLQKTPLVYSAASQFSHPVPSQYTTYAYAPPQHHSVGAGALFQPQASLGKITYAQNGGSAGAGGRGSIYLLH
uniref:Uncharacterized protein n=1 Tax=Anopheles christyi TaxID=43041 RepID=A0A182K6G1_9DIPT